MRRPAVPSPAPASLSAPAKRRCMAVGSGASVARVASVAVGSAGATADWRGRRQQPAATAAARRSRPNSLNAASSPPHAIAQVSARRTPPDRSISRARRAQPRKRLQREHKRALVLPSPYWPMRPERAAFPVGAASLGVTAAIIVGRNGTVRVPWPAAQKNTAFTQAGQRRFDAGVIFDAQTWNLSRAAAVLRKPELAQASLRACSRAGRDPSSITETPATAERSLLGSGAWCRGAGRRA